MNKTEIGKFTHQEIFSQPSTWQEALHQISDQILEVILLAKSNQFNQILFTGCGSTYYLSLAAAAFLQTISGLPCKGIPGSELWLYPEVHLAENPEDDRRTLLVAISRSGETTETLKACQTFLNRGMGKLITISCYPDHPLARLGTINLIIPAGQEHSVAQTRSFSSLYLAACALGLTLSGRGDRLGELTQLVPACQRLLDENKSLANSIGGESGYSRFYLLGSGTRYGLACELSLKMKEMSLSHSEPFHFMEFRHGPMSMVNEETLILGLVSEKNQASETSVLEEMRRLGARCIEVRRMAGDVQLHTSLKEPLYNVLYLPFGQLLAFERAITRGLNPDQPENLKAVVNLPE